MVKNARSSQRREESLSRDRIIEASIAILDSSGESGLTFRTLSERLATGPGAIYWHIASKSELLTAACDAIVARTLNAPCGRRDAEGNHSRPRAGHVRRDRRASVGRLGAHASRRGSCRWCVFSNALASRFALLACRTKTQWATVAALLNYILGVGGQNAANTQFARTRGVDRSDFLDAVATAWSQLDPDEYPFARSLAGQLRAHDDRVDFLAGIDLILGGIKSSRGR